MDIALRAARAQLFSMNKKLRNRLLALGCLAVFLAAGVAFYVNWVVQKPFAIILFLSENLSPSVVTPARIYEGGADHRLHIEKLPHLALVSTHANDFAVADGAAAAATVATGRKVNNRSLAVDAGGTPLPTLLELARNRGRLTGLVSNAALTDATSAAFFAKTQDPLDYQKIALQLVENGSINVLLGGGAADFLPDFKEGRRKDGRDLILEMRNKGYDIVRNRSELGSTPIWRAPKVFGVFSAGNLAFADEATASASQPSLAEMVRQAIQFLQYNPKGYLLVVDAGLAGKAASQNEGERTLREILALDRAVATAVEYAGENALIIVAGKQSVGGLRLNGYPFRNDKGTGLLGINAQGVPSLTWSTGPGSGTTTLPTGVASAEPASFKTAAAIGTAEDAIVVSTGPGSEVLTGFRDNTAIFQSIEKGL
jgi:alkaline phosphatase